MRRTVRTFFMRKHRVKFVAIFWECRSVSETRTLGIVFTESSFEINLAGLPTGGFYWIKNNSNWPCFIRYFRTCLSHHYWHSIRIYCSYFFWWLCASKSRSLRCKDERCRTPCLRQNVTPGYNSIWKGLQSSQQQQWFWNDARYSTVISANTAASCIIYAFV